MRCAFDDAGTTGGAAGAARDGSLRIGLVGTGGWAETTHAVALARSPDAHFAGVWGRHRDKADDLAAAFGVKAYPSFEALLADVDAVAFAIPPDVQAELATRAAGAGRHLLLEKPAALTPQAAARLERAVEASGVACLTFFTLRFDDVHGGWLDQTLELGPWRNAWSLWLSSALLPGGPASGSARRVARGALWDVGPHVLSMVVPALGSVTSVVARQAERGLVHLVMAHDSGASTTASLTLRAPLAARRTELGFWGESGVDMLPPSTIPYWQTLGHAIRDLAGLARRGDGRHPCDMRLSRHVVDVLHAAEVALDEGRAIEVESG